VVPIRPAGPAVKPERTYPMWLPIAASFLAVLGFSFGLYQNSRVAKLEERLSEEVLPWSPPAIMLDDTTVRSGGDQQEVKRITSKDGAILSLYSDVEETFPAYEAEIVGRATVKATPPREEGAPVSLVIPRGYLKPDTYEIQLYGVEGDQRTPLGRYDIQVDEP